MNAAACVYVDAGSYRARSAALDVVLGHEADQGETRDAELLGRLGLDAFGGVEGGEDGFALDAGDALADVESLVGQRAGLLEDLLGEVLAADLGAVGEDDGAFDDVAQLADVTGPA